MKKDARLGGLPVSIQRPESTDASSGLLTVSLSTCVGKVRVNCRGKKWAQRVKDNTMRQVVKLSAVLDATPWPLKSEESGPATMCNRSTMY